MLLLCKPFHLEFQSGLMWLDRSGHVRITDGETEVSEEAGLHSEFMVPLERAHRPSARRPHRVATSLQTVVSSAIIGHTPAAPLVSVSRRAVVRVWVSAPSPATGAG